jgi:hypothetical protein
MILDCIIRSSRQSFCDGSPTISCKQMDGESVTKLESINRSIIRINSVLPVSKWPSMMIRSSSIVQFLFLLISGLRWLCHLSLHCFPDLPGRHRANRVQFLGPCIAIRSCIILSSTFVDRFNRLD